MRLLKDNSLTIILMLLFAGSIVGQWLTGWHVALEEAARHSQPGMSLASYSFSPEFLSSVRELGERVSTDVGLCRAQSVSDPAWLIRIEGSR